MVTLEGFQKGLLVGSFYFRSYAKILMNDGLQANANNPEVNVDVSRQDETIQKQITQLTDMKTESLKAIQGQTASWLSLQSMCTT